MWEQKSIKNEQNDKNVLGPTYKGKQFLKSESLKNVTRLCMHFVIYYHKQDFVNATNEDATIECSFTVGFLRFFFGEVEANRHP